MPRLPRWTITLILAAAASAAAAQVVPDRLPVPNAIETPAPPISAAGKGAASAPPAALEIPNVASRTLRNGTIAVSPMLRDPLSAAPKPLSSVRMTADGIVPSPLLQPGGLRVDFALNSLMSANVADTATGARSLSDARTARLDTIIDRNPGRLDRDETGNPIVRGRILAIDPDSASLRRAAARGFAVQRIERDAVLGLRTVTLQVPAGIGTVNAMRLLRSTAPGLVADYDSIFLPAGGALDASRGRLAGKGSRSRVVIGMVDGGVASHPSLAGRVVDQKGFAGAARPTGHGTAVASLLVGDKGEFRGAAVNASLLVADVYGGQVAGGSAKRIVQALSWLASKHPAVVNVSLVGPHNAVMERAVAALEKLGIEVVAPVGNDGPAAPPQYPASYAGVVAITAVDPSGAALFESGRATHVDFAAPGSDMAAARPDGGYARVRGTSFAAPLAAGRLAILGSIGRLVEEARPGTGRVGRGIVCSECRTDPRLVGAR